jgi:hypothetical protein
MKNDYLGGRKTINAMASIKTSKAGKAENNIIRLVE